MVVQAAFTYKIWLLNNAVYLPQIELQPKRHRKTKASCSIFAMKAQGNPG